MTEAESVFEMLCVLYITDERKCPRIYMISNFISGYLSSVHLRIKVTVRSQFSTFKNMHNFNDLLLGNVNCED